MGNMVVVNGPIRHEIGMNSGVGALGPYNYANSVIGRAFGLLSQNLQGGSVPGDHLRRLAGLQLTPTTASRSPRTRRRAPGSRTTCSRATTQDESTVTVSYIWGNVWAEYLRAYWQEKLVAMISGLEPGMGCTLVLDPIVAREFVETGFDTKEKIAQWIHENARSRSAATGTTYDAQPDPRGGRGGGRAVRELLDAPPDELIPVFEPDRINIVVVGGSSNAQWSAFQGATLEPRYRSSGASPTVSIDRWR